MNVFFYMIGFIKTIVKYFYLTHMDVIHHFLNWLRIFTFFLSLYNHKKDRKKSSTYFLRIRKLFEKLKAVECKIYVLYLLWIKCYLAQKIQIFDHMRKIWKNKSNLLPGFITIIISIVYKIIAFEWIIFNTDGKINFSVGLSVHRPKILKWLHQTRNFPIDKNEDLKSLYIINLYNC